MYQGKYTLIGIELSMFTRKLESQLCYQGIPYDWKFKAGEEAQKIQERAGTHFIPVLSTPDGWMIHDTISIGPMLNDRFEAKVIPESPGMASLNFILEDFFNHWLPRHALHTRWCYADNVIDAGINFAKNMILNKSIHDDFSDDELDQIKDFGSVMKDSFGMRACGVQGAGMDQCDAMQADYAELMDLLAAHFKEHKFLLGNRACLADFALAGTCKAHFLQDPEPRSWLKENEAIIESYVDRCFQASDANATWFAEGEMPETLKALCAFALNNYFVFARASIDAAKKGEKEFELDLGRGTFKARSMKHFEKNRLHVRDELEKRDAQVTFLKDTGLLDFYQSASLL